MKLGDVVDADDAFLTQEALAGLDMKPAHIKRFLRERAALVAQLGASV